MERDSRKELRIPNFVEQVTSLIRSTIITPVSTIALISRRPRPALASAIGHRFDAEIVHQVLLQGNLSELHARLIALGSVDVFLDISDGNAAGRMAALVYHAKIGGLWVSHVPDGHDGNELRKLLKEMAQLRKAGVAPPVRGAESDHRSNFHRNMAALATSVVKVGHQENFVALQVLTETLAKTRDDEFSWASDSRSSVVARLPARTFARGGRVRVCHEPKSSRIVDEYNAPALTARLVHDVECWPQQVAFIGDCLLPDSFNRPGKRRLRSIGQTDWSDLFALRPTRARPQPLSGTYFYLDNIFQPHFGHAMTEQLSKLWAWRSAREQFPQLRALVLDGRGYLDEWQYALFEAAGVPRDAVVAVAGPVIVERLVSTTQGFSRPDYIHPDLRSLYERVGSSLGSKADEQSWPQRVFLSRRGSQRVCRNRAEVEDFHREEGFQVVYPEDYSLATQIKFVREAEVVSGFAGSGMLQICLAGGPKRVIAIAPETYPAHNEAMFSALLGHHLSIIWCDAEIPRLDGRFSVDSFHSAFVFDFARDGNVLREYIA